MYLGSSHKRWHHNGHCLKEPPENPFIAHVVFDNELSYEVLIRTDSACQLADAIVVLFRCTSLGKGLFTIHDLLVIVQIGVNHLASCQITNSTTIVVVPMSTRFRSSRYLKEADIDDLFPVPEIHQRDVHVHWLSRSTLLSSLR